MSPVLFCCAICGYVIYDWYDYGPSSWLKRFRIVYTNSEDACLSGVGIYEDPGSGAWSAPPNGFEEWTNRCRGERLPVMRQRPINGRHGFVFHDACWCLLEKSFHERPIPLDRLLEICGSLPIPLRWEGLCWGHDYGGLVFRDEENHYPWEDQLEQRDLDAEALDCARSNPYDLPETFQLQELSSDLPPSTVVGRGEDCFASLPWEMLEAIAALLPTKDVLNLHSASKSLHGILTSQTFWASRFKLGQERDFVFETRDNRTVTDWMHLYRLTSNTHAIPGLQNRRRIWKLIQLIKEHLKLRRVGLITGGFACLDSDGFRWTRVQGDVRQELGASRGSGFEEGCRILSIERASIPASLCRVACSIIRVADADYVVGLRLIGDSQDSKQLGYVAEGEEHFFEVTSLRGFSLAMGSRGIRALQVISDHGVRSPWFGRPESSPITERLRSTGNITALEVGFDGYKLVTLAVAEAAQNLEQVPDIQAQSLRETALWYPNVPGLDLSLNEASFIGEKPSTCEYRPLSWILFGGPKGVNLRHLTQVIVSSSGALDSIEFHYDIDGHVSKKKLGRRKVSALSKLMRFPIDGRDGEVITTLSTSVERINREDVYSFYKHGKLSTFKIATNRGRSFHFQPSGSSSDDIILKPLEINYGTTLIGLYASQHPEAGLVDLGAISTSIAIEE